MATIRFDNDIVSQAIEEHIGQYDWGNRDCVKVLMRIFELAGHKIPNIMKEWHQYEHDIAVLRCVRKFGSVLDCYKMVFDEYTIRCDREDCDFIILCNKNRTTAGVQFDAHESGGAIMAFQTIIKEVYAYSPHGLVQIEEPLDCYYGFWKIRRF